MPAASSQTGENNVFENLGHHLATARHNRGLSQKALAERCGLTQAYLSLLERGVRTPSLGQLARLADALCVPLQWFINGNRHPGQEGRDLALELYDLGIVDLIFANPVVPGSFRPPEQVLALVLRGDRVDPRVVEAVPAVLAWNHWDARLVMAYGRLYDARVCHRAAWLADVTQTIHALGGFPGGCEDQRQFSALCRRAKRPAKPDSLGYPAGEDPLPPVSRRWNVTYAADLETFRQRAEHLHELRTSSRRHRATKRRSRRE